MKYALVFVAGLLIGHFGPVFSAKWTAHKASQGMHFVGKGLDTVGNLMR